MDLFLVRHGEIESNVRKVYAGSSDEGLTMRGKEQARAAGRELAAFEPPVARLVCSPLRRAVQTASLIGGFLDLAPRPEPAFRELELGPWQGLSEEEIAQRFPADWALWNSRPAELALPGRETLEQLLGRVLAGVEALRRQKPAGPVLVVTHVAIIRVLVLHRDGRNLNEYKKLPVANAGIFPFPDF